MVKLCRAAGAPEPEFTSEAEALTVISRADGFTPELVVRTDHMSSTFSYPAPSAASLVQRLADIPAGKRPRRWVLLDDNQQHYHGVLRLSESPVVLELRWKLSAIAPEQLVGRFRLHLPEMLAADLIRFEHEGERGELVRVRFYRGAGGVVVIQARADRPALAVGQVDVDLHTCSDDSA